MKVDKRKLPEGWKWVKLGEVLAYEQPNKYIVKDEQYDKRHGIPVLTPGKTFILGFTQEHQGIYNNIPVIIFDDFTTESRYIAFPFKLKSSAVKILKSKCNFVNLYYVYNSMQLLNFKPGSEHKRFWISEYSKFLIPLPPLPEQRKIAEILETIDNAIEKTDAIIEKYKRIKQGLMQDLLTKGVVNEGEGESERWRLRDENIDKFKDSPLGRIPEEWEVVDVYGHVNLINGGTPSTERPEFWNGSIPWLSVEDFNIGKRWVFSSSKYITELGLKQSATKLLKKGMLIISARGTVGVLAQLGADMAFNQSCYGLDAKDKMKLSNDFLYYALKHFITSFLSLAYGNVFNTITRETFKEILIPLPPLPEQQRIASILSQIDEVIEKEQAYKEKLERIKKGLMEDLLTGKVRVNHLIEEEEK
ncbi:restriction modification system DNA specificity domain [Caldicellulosiruptor kronotskyensis 2002]|uniref:Restriction modification system DNA specificity domain n=1 Tax=Caldicellulosiruptor kronotskyensis (strain DSM 18902 / VKM B-2412 / 2002) TaxID=632348 RepID=E4SFV9_CALK2|nr:restriction modification system DNA specificity domain [Caldicellulosiruptor kronotskyensis 2002]